MKPSGARRAGACGVVGAMALAALLQAQKPESDKTPPATLAGVDASLPVVAMPMLDEPRAQWLVAQPFACLDELQPRPTNRPYFWDATFRPVDGYDRVRAFYGCGDWHSAVNATWTLATVLRRMPDISVGRLIREKLIDHLSKSNLDGELAFFKDAAAFERPYGYAWLLTLGADLQTWNDTQAAQWAGNVSPLARYMSEQFVTYLKDLEKPVRSGGQTNSALVLALALDASETQRDYGLRAAVLESATRWFGKDTDCAMDADTAPTDLVTPCLAEAALMAHVLDRATFAAWFDHFLPAVTTPSFRPLLTASTTPAARQGGAGAGRGAAPSRGVPLPTATPDPAAAGRGRGAGGTLRAMPIALALTRADEFTRLSSALGPADPRARVFAKLAAIHADAGVRALSDPAAVDAPWLGAFALRVLAPATPGATVPIR